MSHKDREVGGEHVISRNRMCVVQVQRPWGGNMPGVVRNSKKANVNHEENDIFSLFGH